MAQPLPNHSHHRPADTPRCFPFSLELTRLLL